MQVTINKERVYWLIDELLARWQATPKRYPFNRPDSIIPQTIIPDGLRQDKRILSNWYIAVDGNMKGRVASLEAFRGHIRIWEKYPWFYDPKFLLWEKPGRIEDIYQEFLPIDKKINTRALFINYRHLMQYYDSSGINLIKGVKNWDEAVRRILNKRTKKALDGAGYAGQGLFGHQHKMVSMLVYFYDWEKLLKPRFPYPSPADIHNFRVGLTSGGIVVTGAKNGTIRDYEAISAPWRAIVMQYIIECKKDPIDVADVLWLFSNLMCGNSPMTHTPRDPEPATSGMFSQEDLQHHNGVKQFLHGKYRKDLQETCLICPLLDGCGYAIPAQPYYSVGSIVLRPRPRIEDHIDRTHMQEPVYPAQQEHQQTSFNLLE